MPKCLEILCNATFSTILMKLSAQPTNYKDNFDNNYILGITTTLHVHPTNVFTIACFTKKGGNILVIIHTYNEFFYEAYACKHISFTHVSSRKKKFKRFFLCIFPMIFICMWVDIEIPIPQYIHIHAHVYNCTMCTF